MPSRSFSRADLLPKPAQTRSQMRLQRLQVFEPAARFPTSPTILPRRPEPTAILPSHPQKISPEESSELHADRCPAVDCSRDPFVVVSQCLSCRFPRSPGTLLCGGSGVSPSAVAAISSLKLPRILAITPSTAYSASFSMTNDKPPQRLFETGVQVALNTDNRHCVSDLLCRYDRWEWRNSLTI